MKLSAKIKLFSGVPFLERLLFTKHLSTMIKAGIVLTEALDSLVNQTKSKNFRKVLSSVLGDVKNGQSLANSFGKYPQIFDQFYISLVEVGETSGTLEKSLDFLAKQLAKEYSLRKKVQAAMLYPALVFTATFIMGGFISLFVLPKLVGFFEAFETELPMTTKILLFFANMMKNYGIILISSFLAGIVLVSLTLQTSHLKPWWHKTILRLPLFGELLTYGQLARFSRNFGTMLKSGVSITRSLEITANTLSNMRFKKNLLEINQSLSKGKNIGNTLEQKKFREFPPLVSKMISVGEKTGKLDDSLMYLGDFYEDEIDNISKNLTTILEPILLIVIGLVVGFVALAIISPIYELTGSIRR